MNGPPIRIIGLGASTPIGRTVWTSAASVRAGISGFSEHPFLVDTSGEPMRVARAPWLDTDVEGADRSCRLMFPAIDEALASLRDERRRHGSRIGLAVALPPPRPGVPSDLASRISEAVLDRYPGVFTKTVTFEVGHAAGHLAIEAAMRSFAGRQFDMCMIAGVDSYLTPETLEWVEACDQLNGAGRWNNAWGFIPGEAAGAILLATDSCSREVGAECYGDLVAVGTAKEDKLIKTDAVCIGEGLTRAFRAALEAIALGDRIHNVFCDLNGETYRADEYGFAALRTKDRFRAPTDFVAPADCWGDVGAAGAPLHAALGVIAHRKRYSKGPLSLVCSSSESGERGAAVILGVDPPKA